MRKYFALLVIMTAIACNPKKSTDNSQPPSWATDAIWYQIFVERFHNSDPGNDPTIKTISTPTASFPVPDEWQITPWDWDWYEQESWAAQTGRSLRETLQHRRYGGDLQGVLDKLDYLVDLGINAIYFNPLNDAPSLHKYDARSYHHIDVNFGPDPEGDLQIIASEDFADPSTWKWTSADKLFLKLVEECHKRNIRVVLDYSWNHTGVLFPAWQDLVKNQQESEFSDWYDIIAFDDPATDENEFKYKGWLNIKSLPEFKKVDVVGERPHGKPFEGNLHPEVKEHVFAVTKRWLAPDGDRTKGIDGFRLDVAEQIPLGFWRDYRNYVKQINPDAYLVGEIWWENWPETFINPAIYTGGDMFDAVMFYHAYRPARQFFIPVEDPFDAQALAYSLHFEWGRLKENYPQAMMNVNATHDAPRLLTCFANPGIYKYRANPYEDPAYITGKPDEDTYQRVRLYLMHQFTIIGAPHIWNGDEMGMWGGDDPDCRKPLWWKDMVFKPEARTNIQPGEKTYDEVGFNQEHFDFYKHLIQIRKNNPVLAHGKIEFLIHEGKKLVYKRFDNNEVIYALFNLDQNDLVFETEGVKNYLDLMTGQTIPAASLTVKPMSAMILKAL